MVVSCWGKALSGVVWYGVRIQAKPMINAELLTLLSLIEACFALPRPIAERMVASRDDLLSQQRLGPPAA